MNFFKKKLKCENCKKDCATFEEVEKEILKDGFHKKGDIEKGKLYVWCKDCALSLGMTSVPEFVKNGYWWEFVPEWVNR